MLESVTFEGRMGGGEYRRRHEELKKRLMVLQQQAKVVGLGTVVLFEGWGCAGKGARISDLVVNLDPRLYSVHTIEDPVGHESRLPFMARFWNRLGAHGTMTIFDQAYYNALTRIYVEEVRHAGDVGLDADARASLRRKAKERINLHINSARAFERQLTADGYLIVKFFLHITQEEQRRRAVELMLDPSSSWKVSEHDISQLQHHGDYERAFDMWLEDAQASETGQWYVVPSLYRRNANIQIMQALADEMTAALEARGFDTSQPIPAGDARHAAQEAWQACGAGSLCEDEQTEGDAPDDETPCAATAGEPAAGTGEQAAADAAPDGRGDAADPQDDAGQKPAKLRPKDIIGTTKGLRSRFKLVPVPSLDDVRHDRRLSEDEYKAQLKTEQAELADLSLQIYRRRIPLIIAYEGWDAAGKGGNIKRVAAALDARNYAVHPIAAATPDELAHPFLWRFWTQLPRTGHTAIFDRTWYGRVLVERVEGFATPAEWRRAFEEINEFEDDLHTWGAVLVKLWIDVSSDEQLRRFHDRESDPSRRWKITDDDWRNREKNDLYRICINDMLRLTSTEFAPWTVVESDDKRYARVKALKVINKAIRKRLER